MTPVFAVVCRSTASVSQQTNRPLCVSLAPGPAMVRLKHCERQALNTSYINACAISDGELVQASQAKDLRCSTSEPHVNESVCCLSAYSVREKSLLVPPMEMNEKGLALRKQRMSILISSNMKLLMNEWQLSLQPASC